MSRIVSSLNPASDLRRHALVWLQQAPQPDLEPDAAEVERWYQRGNPWVVCRHRGKPDHVSLGFCLASVDFPGRRPQRISAQAPRELLLRVERPPSLADIAASSSTGAMTHAFSLLSTAASGEGLNLRVFGSWMWQALTGDAHVSPNSDLDVLIDVANEAEANHAVAFLKRQETACPIKIDGELSLPGRGEVQWREYQGNVPEVLLKSMTTVRLIPRKNLWT